MNQLLSLREKRANLWNETKKFLADHRDENGLVPAEFLDAYDKMTNDVRRLGDEIKRLEEQAEIDRIIDAPVPEQYEGTYYCCRCKSTVLKTDNYCHECGRPINWYHGHMI